MTGGWRLILVDPDGQQREAWQGTLDRLCGWLPRLYWTLRKLEREGMGVD